MRDEDQRTASTLSRRSMIAGSAFSVPVIMSVAATPAMAASFNVISRRAVQNKDAPSVGSYAPGSIQLNSAQVWYDPNVWGVAWNEPPDIANVTWTVVVLDASGSIVRTPVPSRTMPLAKWGNDQVTQVTVSGLAAGTYTVSSRITSVSYSPNPVGVNQFVTLPSELSSTVTVAAAA